MKSIGPSFVFTMLTLAGSAAAQQYAPSPEPAQQASTPRAAVPRAPTPAPQGESRGQPAPQGFSVVLVLGDLNNASAGDANVPPAARKALNDMKDFLPYKGYRLLDAEWILGAHNGTTRLRGPEGQDYELTLQGGTQVSASGAVKQRVTFRLREAGGDSGGGDVALAQARMAERMALEQRARDLEREIAALRERGEKTAEITARASQLAELRHRLDSEAPAMSVIASRGRWVMDTSFDMEIGETVVVGTSRLKDSGKDGGRALIALLTAVPKGGAGAKPIKE